MQQPKKKRTVQRGGHVYIAGVQFKEPFDMELLAMALLDVVEALEPAQKAELVLQGQKLMEHLHLNARDTDQQQAA
jgi:hypothetical protein